MLLIVPGQPALAVLAVLGTAQPAQPIPGNCSLLARVSSTCTALRLPLDQIPKRGSSSHRPGASSLPCRRQGAEPSHVRRMLRAGSPCSGHTTCTLGLKRWSRRTCCPGRALGAWCRATLRLPLSCGATWCRCSPKDSPEAPPHKSNPCCVLMTVHHQAVPSTPQWGWISSCPLRATSCRCSPKDPPMNVKHLLRLSMHPPSCGAT